MDKIILKRRFHLGKVDAYGTGRKGREVTIDLTLTERGGDPTFTVASDGTRTYTGNKTPEYTELSISGSVGSIWSGQCLDMIATVSQQMTMRNQKTFRALYELWNLWHLNGLHAGTPEQEAAIAEWEAAGNRYKYETVCEMLKERGLYEIPFTGKTVGRMYNNELYRYGHGWVVVDLPESVIAECKALVEADKERE